MGTTHSHRFYVDDDKMRQINSINIANYIEPLKNMVDDVNDNDKIWKVLVEKDIFPYTDIYECKLFAIKICQNNVRYVKNNYKYVKDKGMLKYFIVLSAIFCTDIEITQFLFSFSLNNVVDRYDGKKECLYYAFVYNPSLKMLRYLIEICGANVNTRIRDLSWPYFHPKYYDNRDNKRFKGIASINGICSLSDLIFGNNSIGNYIEKAIYIIENTNIIIELQSNYITKYIQIISGVKKSDKLNNLINIGLKTYSLNKMKSIVQLLNPLLIETKIRDLFDIKISGLFDHTYDIFCHEIDEIKSTALLKDILNEGYLYLRSCSTEYDVGDIGDINNVDMDKSEILFNCCGTDYRGDKEKVYSVMTPMKEILASSDFSSTIVLSQTLPDYILKKYIESCYTNKFNINCIKPKDIIQFIEFIDQYPTNLLTMSNFEVDIVKFFEKHKVNPFQTNIRDVCDKYQLKLVYLFLKIK